VALSAKEKLAHVLSAVVELCLIDSRFSFHYEQAISDPTRKVFPYLVWLGAGIPKKDLKSDPEFHEMRVALKDLIVRHPEYIRHGQHLLAEIQNQQPSFRWEMLIITTSLSNTPAPVRDPVIQSANDRKFLKTLRISPETASEEPIEGP
jgi:hypothetical protein